MILLEKYIRNVLLEDSSFLAKSNLNINKFFNNLPVEKNIDSGSGGGGGGIEDNEEKEGGGENEKEVLKKALIKYYLEQEEKVWSYSFEFITNSILLPILLFLKSNNGKSVSKFKARVESINEKLQSDKQVVTRMLGGNFDFNSLDKKTDDYKTFNALVETTFILETSDWLDIIEKVCESRSCKEEVSDVFKILNTKIKEVFDII